MDRDIAEAQIERQHSKLREINEELREASNSYEMTPFNGSSPEYVALLERKLERHKADYDKERSILDDWYSQKRKIAEQMSAIGNDLFGEIYYRCSGVLSSVQSITALPYPAATLMGIRNRSLRQPISL